ncbi:MAG: Holliday junction resolvase RuvX, partial [Firmicutes bacterium]|nr:Holliday junction resolvase RuvX [Bacillota bacterium]
NLTAALERLAELCREHEVALIVAGLPLHLDGGRGEAARAVEKFAGAAGKRTGLPVEFVDERLTTRAAERTLLAAGMKRRARKKVRDKVAAVLILETFLRSSGCPDDNLPS